MNNTKMLLEDGYPNEDYYASLLFSLRNNLMINGLNQDLKEIFLYSTKELKEVSDKAIVSSSIVLIDIDFLQTHDTSNQEIINVVSDLVNAPEKHDAVILSDEKLLGMLKEKGFDNPVLFFESAMNYKNLPLKEKTQQIKFFTNKEEVEYLKNLKEKVFPEFLHDYIQLNTRTNSDDKKNLALEFANKLAQDTQYFSDPSYALMCYTVGAEAVHNVFKEIPNKFLHNHDVVGVFSNRLHAKESCDNARRDLMVEYLTASDKNILSNSRHNPPSLTDGKKKKKR